MGDVPYGSGDIPTLDAQIQNHNAKSDSRFMVHLGDIKTGASACDEAVYLSVAAQLRALEVPTFIIPGDNEWNDCDDPDQAWGFWDATFMGFDDHWPGAPVVERQAERRENFAWAEENVLLMGINLVGGKIHDQDEWNTRMQQDADWVADHFANAADVVYAAVVFGHALPASKHDLFFEQFRAAAATFGRPVLYLHGDGHVWIQNRPWPETNILRVEVDAGGKADPVRVTVSADDPETFAFDRTPFD
jgi:hypothetical protein